MHFCVSLPFIGKIDRSLEGTYIYIAGSLLLQAIVSGVVLAVPVSFTKLWLLNLPEDSCLCLELYCLYMVDCTVTL